MSTDTPFSSSAATALLENIPNVAILQQIHRAQTIP